MGYPTIFCYVNTTGIGLSKTFLKNRGIEMMEMFRNSGFTLVELLIVCLIISILAAIALPNYNQYVMKSRRSDGTSTLNNITLAQEQYRSNNTSYGTLANVWSSTTTPNGYYTLAVTNPTATGYTVTATAVGNQAADSQAGVNCATLTLVVNGLTTTQTPNTCWTK